MTRNTVPYLIQIILNSVTYITCSMVDKTQHSYHVVRVNKDFHETWPVIVSYLIPISLNSLTLWCLQYLFGWCLWKMCAVHVCKLYKMTNPLHTVPVCKRVNENFHEIWPIIVSYILNSDWVHDACDVCLAAVYGESVFKTQNEKFTRC